MFTIAQSLHCLKERLQLKVAQKIYLPSTFNHDECQNIYDECKKNFETSESLVFNASDVERVGTAGIQILLAAGLFCRKNNKTCTIEAPSKALIAAFDHLGCICIVKDLGMIL